MVYIPSTNARDFIYLALKEAGVLGVGQDPLAEDLNDAFALMQNMMGQWQKKRWLVPQLKTISRVWDDGERSHTIGNGGWFNTDRPDKIQSAYANQINTGSPPVSFPLKRIFSRENYDLLAIKGLNSFPTAFFYDAAYPKGNIFVWPIPAIQTYEIFITIKNYIGFAAGIQSGIITNVGIGYTDGPYVGVPLIGGSGDGATADIVIAGGVVTDFNIVDIGNGYAVNDNVTIDAALAGGTGVGFLFNVTNTKVIVDSEFNMPDEYAEAIHYNLALRLISMYDKPAKPMTVALAKSSLNTLRKANNQISTLVMPSGIRRPRIPTIFNPDYTN